MSEPLDIQDYLDATSDAAKRSRNASITVVIASVLVFAGLLNSLQNSWMMQRLHECNDMNSNYVTSKIGVRPQTNDRTIIAAYENRYKEFYAALMRTYVDNSYVIRVPFFGFRVDANDLGLVGGIAFVIILIMLRFSISREVDNLNTSFTEAETLGQLPEFYVLLAMRQVFTVPASDSINRTPFLMWVPKLFCFAPLLVYIAVVGHDVATSGIGLRLSDVHTIILFCSEALLVVMILILTRMVVRRLRRVDELWDRKWTTVRDTLKAKRLQLPASATSGEPLS